VDSALVLLRHNRRLLFSGRALQQGHRGKDDTSASINRLRMVAIEFEM
jgi:hypothetical protein